MRGLVLALVASAAVLAGCTDKEEVQVPATETTVVTPAATVQTPAPTEAPAPAAETTTVVTPVTDATAETVTAEPAK